MSHSGTKIERDIRGHGVEEDIWTEETGGSSRLDDTARLIRLPHAKYY